MGSETIRRHHNLGDYLRKLRQRKSMSQEELAEKIGVKQPQVSRWEKGTRIPDNDSFKKLMGVFPELNDELIHDMEESEDSTRHALWESAFVPATGSVASPWTLMGDLPPSIRLAGRGPEFFGSCDGFVGCLRGWRRR